MGGRNVSHFQSTAGSQLVKSNVAAVFEDRQYQLGKGQGLGLGRVQWIVVPRLIGFGLAKFTQGHPQNLKPIRGKAIKAYKMLNYDHFIVQISIK